MVGQLTAEDCDNIDHIRTKGWFLSSRSGKPYKTRKVGSLDVTVAGLAPQEAAR